MVAPPVSFDIIKGDSIDTMCMQDNTNYNRNYKDSLFRFIFNNKEAALSLYNAVNDKRLSGCRCD